jgi:hypothetical protein
LREENKKGRKISEKIKEPLPRLYKLNYSKLRIISTNIKYL